MSWIDLLFMGRSRAIATAVIAGGNSVALVDPGPTTCLETLELGLQAQGLRLEDLTHLLLTHIHLDHAGATGVIVRRLPHIQVLVHERGVPHLTDPTKLLQSATRLYGDSMDRLWGEVAPVPAANLIALAGGERIGVADRWFEVAYTPGHASHHVSYFDRSSDIAFVGDTAGVCIDHEYVLPPTPPPDIDLELWRESVGRIEAWNPNTLFITHFGPITTVRRNLQALLENLEVMSGLVRRLLTSPGTDEEKARSFGQQFRQELRRHMHESKVPAYSIAAPLELLWLGLARYWRKREGLGPG
jgi:glyoxylase-like metal-dependent hydrolase (beta-lactamase superfamily II)